MTTTAHWFPAVAAMFGIVAGAIRSRNRRFRLRDTTAAAVIAAAAVGAATIAWVAVIQIDATAERAPTDSAASIVAFDAYAGLVAACYAFVPAAVGAVVGQGVAVMVTRSQRGQSG